MNIIDNRIKQGEDIVINGKKPFIVELTTGEEVICSLCYIHSKPLYNIISYSKYGEIYQFSDNDIISKPSAKYTLKDLHLSGMGHKVSQPEINIDITIG